MENERPGRRGADGGDVHRPDTHHLRIAGRLPPAARTARIFAEPAGGQGGVSRTMLGYVEAEKYVPTAETMARVAAALGMTFGQFCAEVDQWLAGLPLYQLHLEAWRWLQRQPASCRKCHYSCVHRGRQKWLNQARQCTRPQKAPSAPAATLPVAR